MRSTMLVVAGALVLAGYGCDDHQNAGERGSASASQAVVAYAVDGDTLRVRLPSGDLPYVRLIGIDTPEEFQPGTPVECGALAATASMRQLAPGGATAILRGDSVADATDRYGRILAHVFVAGRQLEVVQLRRGWAEVYRFEDQRFDGLARFESAERRARYARRGVWGTCGGDFHSSR